MTCIDLKDAYFLISITSRHRRFLRFLFNDQLYEFTCMPFGLSVAPLCFTKIMKPVVSALRSSGVLCVNYLDDFMILSDSFTECTRQTTRTVNLLNSLGFIINREKSNLHPNTYCRYLGFCFNSLSLKLELPVVKKHNIRKWALYFQNKPGCKIRLFAKFIGILVAACPAVEYGWLYTKSFERHKFLALLANNGKYEATMVLPQSLNEDLLWWERNISSASNSLEQGSFAVEIFTDASLTGWGVYCNKEKTHGYWSAADRSHHINYLELQAIFYGLKSFAKTRSKCRILIRCDNTTAISYINRMGSIQHPQLNALTRDIWQWCESRQLHLFASYISSQNNFEADRESRQLPLDTEWTLSDSAFSCIVSTFGSPTIDLFASKLNHKCRRYVSWLRDPDSVAVDAFTLSWSDLYFYAFPPFNLILRTLNKIVHDNAVGILVVPWWPTQPWFPLFVQLLVQDTITFEPDPNLLLSPFREHHPLAKTLTLAAGILSGKRTAGKTSLPTPSP